MVFKVLIDFITVTAANISRSYMSVRSQALEVAVHGAHVPLTGILIEHNTLFNISAGDRDVRHFT